MRRWFILGVLGLGVLASCSVKEERGSCPCWLTVYAPENASLSAWYGTRTLFQNQKGQITDRQVPRGTVEVTASKGRFRVNINEPIDSLYAARAVINTNAESATETILLNKQFATVDVEFVGENPPSNAGALRYKGNVCGADERTLEPLEGSFQATPEIQADGSFRANVPRQKDDSLTLELLDNGTSIDSIPLGTLIKKAGFDWTKESLGDIRIRADIPAHSYMITILEWNKVISTTIII